MTTIDPLKPLMSALATLDQVKAFDALFKDNNTPTADQEGSVFGITTGKLNLTDAQRKDLRNAAKVAESNFASHQIFQTEQPPSPNPQPGKLDLPAITAKAGSATIVDLTDPQATAANWIKDKTETIGNFEVKFIEGEGSKKQMSITPKPETEVGDKTIEIGNAKVKVTVTKGSVWDWFNAAKSPVVAPIIYAAVAAIIAFFIGKSTST